MRRLAVILGAGAFALAVGGLAMAASKGLKERSVAFSIDGLGEATAQCKQGQEAVAGGFFGPPDSAYPYDSEREGERGWRTRLYSGANPADVTAYVYCDKKEPGLKLKSETEISPSPPATETVSAKCGRGKEAVSGGYNTADAELIVMSSKRVGKRSWEVGYVASSGTPITALALCDKSEPGLKTKEASTTPLTESESAIAKCKRKQELRSGGFDAEYDYDTGPDYSVAHGSRKQGKRRWEVAATGVGGSPTVTAYAYCDRKERKN
jgi:hypothetical protein